MGIMGPLRAPRHVAGRGARLSGTGRKAPGFRGPQHRLTGCRFGTRARIAANRDRRSEEHTSELQSLMRISYAVFCLKKKTTPNKTHKHNSILHTNPNTYDQPNIN